MKKILIPTLAVLSLFALVSCGENGLPTGLVTTTPGGTTPGATTTTQTTTTEVKTITEANFNEVVKNYGFLGQNANITYDFVFTRGEQSLTGYMKAQSNKFELDYGQGASFFAIRTEGNGIVQDDYYKNPTTNTYTIRTSPFGGYYYDFGEMGLVFDRLTFNDFEFKAETNTYELKSAKTFTYEDAGTITLSAIKFKFVNNVLLNIDITYAIGTTDVSGHVVFTAKNVGTTTITLPTATSPQGGDTNPNAITEEKFVELIKDHGFMGQKANATYDYTFTMGSGYSSTGYIKADAGKFEIDYGYGPFFLQIRTEGNGIVQDDYNKRAGETSYRKTTSTFKGYFYNFGELGLSFDQLEFDDFELDSESNVYELKESKSFTYELGTITFHFIELQFIDNVLVSAEVLFKLNDEESMSHSVFTAKNIGTTTVTLPAVTPAPTDTYEISETDFATLITNAGFIGPQAKATYSYTSRSGENTSEGIVAFDNNKFLIRNQHDIYMHVRTEGNGLVVDSYSSGDGTNWYTSTVPFPGYWTCFASYGLSFKDLTFEDFEFNSSQNRYDLKEAARIALTLGSSEMIINYNELHLQIKNGVLINIEFIADITFSGDPMHVVATYNKTADAMTVTLPEIQQPEEWEASTYTAFAAAFEAKAAAPYNKVEITYADGMGNMVPHDCVATYALDTWTVNEDPDDMGWSDSFINLLFLSEDALVSYGSAPANVVVTFEKKGDSFRMTSTQTYSPGTENERVSESIYEYDKYFAMTYGCEKTNGQKTSEFTARWSTVENPTVTLVGNSFKVLDYHIDDMTEKDEGFVDDYINSIITINEDNTFEWYVRNLMGMGEALAYGTWTINNDGTYSYTQTGIINGGERHDMPEEIRKTFSLSITGNILTIASSLTYPEGSGPDAVVVKKDAYFLAVKALKNYSPVIYKEEITYEQLIADFEKRESLPYDKVDIIYALQDSTENKPLAHELVGELVDDAWVITDNPDDLGHVENFVNDYIITAEYLAKYSNLPSNVTLKIEKEGKKYTLTATVTTPERVVVTIAEFNEYFVITHQTQKANNEVVGEARLNWSVKAPERQ